MVNVKIEHKSRIDGFIIKAACSNLKRFTAPYVAKNEKIDVNIVRTRLFQLKDDDQVIVNYDVICPECYDVLETYHSEKDIHLGKMLFCENSEDEVVVEPSNVLVNFSPNKKYYTKEICKKFPKAKKKF